MSRGARILAEARAATYTFARRRTAVVFTFLFPLLIVTVFGTLVAAGPAAGGVFAQDPGYYVPGYLGTVVVFTPLSRLGSTVARHREQRRFEKLATTPLTRGEWIVAHTVVTVGVVLVASAIILAVAVVVTGATVHPTAYLPAYVVAGTALFAGLGAVFGRVAATPDGVIAASNTVAFPIVFLSETFIAPTLLPAWSRPVMALSPLTYFSRGLRAAATTARADVGDPAIALAIVAGLGLVALAAGAMAIPRTE